MFGLSKRTGKYNEARGLLDSHIKYLEKVESLYEDNGRLISFNMLSQVELYKSLTLDNGVVLYLVCKHSNKIVGIVHCEPNSKVNSQWHDVDEKFVIIKGEILMSIEDTVKELKENDTITVPGGQVHSTYHNTRAIYIVEFLKECQ